MYKMCSAGMERSRSSSPFCWSRSLILFNMPLTAGKPASNTREESSGIVSARVTTSQTHLLLMRYSTPISSTAVDVGHASHCLYSCIDVSPSPPLMAIRLTGTYRLEDINVRGLDGKLVSRICMNSSTDCISSNIHRKFHPRSLATGMFVLHTTQKIELFAFCKNYIRQK